MTGVTHNSDIQPNLLFVLVVLKLAVPDLDYGRGFSDLLTVPDILGNGEKVLKSDLRIMEATGPARNVI
jgi:hypothetical protein